MADLLAIADLHAGYGRGDIVKGVHARVAAGEMVTIIGPNGAGKSTFLKALAGVARTSAGSVRLEGSGDIAGLRPSLITRHGLAYVPQEANVFRTLTVQENLELGAWSCRRALPERLAELQATFPILSSKRHEAAGHLSGGERQMVALAMALVSKPRILLLDEPSAGLSPKLADVMFRKIREINEAQKIAILMVEQNARAALRMSHRGYVFTAGRVHLEDTAPNLLASPEVVHLFLGGASR
jgi:branched-chain amino acid transport system ATP-binding protein